MVGDRMMKRWRDIVMDCGTAAAAMWWRLFKELLCALLWDMCSAHCPIVSSIDREGGHTPDLTAALYLWIALCVCVCVCAPVCECVSVCALHTVSMCVFCHIYTKTEKSLLIMVYGNITMTLTTVWFSFFERGFMIAFKCRITNLHLKWSKQGVNLLSNRWKYK